MSPTPDSLELLGSTKRLNINYQDADGYVQLAKGWSPGRGKRKGPGAPQPALSHIRSSKYVCLELWVLPV